MRSCGALAGLTLSPARLDASLFPPPSKHQLQTPNVRYKEPITIEDISPKATDSLAHTIENDALARTFDLWNDDDR